MITINQRFHHFDPHIALGYDDVDDDSTADRAYLIIPKSASSTILDIFHADLTGWNCEDVSISASTSNNLPSTVRHKFYVIRNPVDRAMSMYMMLKRNGIPYIEMTPDTTFDEYLEFVDTQLPLPDCDPHFRPHSDFIARLSENHGFECVLLENLDEYLIKIGCTPEHINITETATPEVSDKAIEDINRMYAIDCELYKANNR